MSTIERVRALVAPLVEQAGLDLYDLDLAGGLLSVLVDRDGGADIDTISTVSRAISRALDEDDPIDGHYSLEVGTPGLERPLRTPAHFARAVGTTVKVKTKPGTDGDRRIEGTISRADDSSVTVTTGDGTERTLDYDQIERARTTFEWGSAAAKQKQEKKA